MRTSGQEYKNQNHIENILKLKYGPTMFDNRGEFLKINNGDGENESML